MSRAAGWAKLMSIARHCCGAVCPLCDRPNNDLYVKYRQHPDQAKTNPNMDSLSYNYRSQWQCKHCGAWHTGEQLVGP